MTKWFEYLILFFFTFTLWLAQAALLHAEQHQPNAGMILISSEIKPFIEMVEGLEAGLSMPLCRVFMDKKGVPYSPDPVFKQLKNDYFAFAVAVGPEALSWFSVNEWHAPLFYGMILRNHEIDAMGEKQCGVSLNLFSPRQLRDIQQILPSTKRLGLFLTPGQNQIWQELLRSAADVPEIKLVPINVTRESDIKTSLNQKLDSVDAIYFIPDAAIASPVLIQYIIKQAISRGIPTIGYNTFFHKSGSVLSFTISYHKIGTQVAQIINNFFLNGTCQSQNPNYIILMNQRVLDLLQINIGKSLPDNLEQQP